jgi:hypothetical protein
MPELTSLDERLAEIDERLRSLQSGLDAGIDPSAEAHPSAEALVPPMPPPAHAQRPAFAPVGESPTPTPLRQVPALDADAGARTDRLLTQLHELGDAHERLLELHRQLLSQYAELLERRAGDAAAVPVVAGPFADASALRGFEHGLRGLPGVCEVTIREFLDGDRVALEVRLASP